MTLSEFKAWLEGYSEALDGAPTVFQWDKILLKLKSVKPDTQHAPTIQYPPGKRQPMSQIDSTQESQ